MAIFHTPSNTQSVEPLQAVSEIQPHLIPSPPPSLSPLTPQQRSDADHKSSVISLRPSILMNRNVSSVSICSNNARRVRYADRVAKLKLQEHARRNAMRSVGSEMAMFTVGDENNTSPDANKVSIDESTFEDSPSPPYYEAIQQQSSRSMCSALMPPASSVNVEIISNVSSAPSPVEDMVKCYEYPQATDDDDEANDGRELGDFMSPEEARFRQSQARHSFWHHVSALYGVVLFVLGISLPIAETASKQLNSSYYLGYYVYLYTVSTAFLLIMLFFLMKRAQPPRIILTQIIDKLSGTSNDLQQYYAGSGTHNKRGQLLRHPEGAAPPFRMQQHSNSNMSDEDYRQHQSKPTTYRRASATDLPHAATSEHHGTFYLRLGAVLFGLAAMILTSFQLGQFLEHVSTSTISVDVMRSEGDSEQHDVHPDNKVRHRRHAVEMQRFNNAESESHAVRHVEDGEQQMDPVNCADFMAAFAPISQFFFLFVQTYFVFVGTKVRTDMYTVWIRFGLMHVVGTNLCIWLHVLVEETKHAMEHYAHEVVNGSPHSYMSKVDDDMNKEWFVRYIEHVHGDRSPLESTYCRNTSVMGRIQQAATPFLFPFLVEYSLIAAATLYVMWSQIGINPITKLRPAALRKISTRDQNGGDECELVGHSLGGGRRHTRRTQDRITVDIGGASRGLFFGLMMVVMTVISLVLFFTWISMPAYEMAALMLVYTTEIALYLVCTIAVVFAMLRMRKLKFDNDAGSSLDDLLLNISQVGVYAVACFTIICGYHMIMDDDDWHTQFFALCAVILETIQATLQTLFLHDATRRRPANAEHVRIKPARETVTFLLVCNIGIWAVKSLESWRYQLHPVQIKFYGFWTWTLLTHICSPLMIYYRFHSSVMLSEVWKQAHKIKINHHQR